MRHTARELPLFAVPECTAGAKDIFRSAGAGRTATHCDVDVVGNGQGCSHNRILPRSVLPVPTVRPLDGDVAESGGGRQQEEVIAIAVAMAKGVKSTPFGTLLASAAQVSGRRCGRCHPHPIPTIPVDIFTLLVFARPGQPGWPEASLTRLEDAAGLLEGVGEGRSGTGSLLGRAKPCHSLIAAKALKEDAS